MSEPATPLALEPVFDSGAAPVTCAVCNQRVVRTLFPGEPEPACPLCHGREARALALEAGAVPAGPWPRLVLRRGQPLANGALSCEVPGSEVTLESPEGSLARLRREGERLLVCPLVAGARLGGRELAAGEEREMSPGDVLALAGRELTG